MMPLPNEEVTPPVTKMCLVLLMKILLRDTNVFHKSPVETSTLCSFQQNLPYSVTTQLNGSSPALTFMESNQFFTFSEASFWSSLNTWK